MPACCNIGEDTPIESVTKISRARFLVVSQWFEDIKENKPPYTSEKSGLTMPLGGIHDGHRECDISYNFSKVTAISEIYVSRCRFLVQRKQIKDPTNNFHTNRLFTENGVKIKVLPYLFSENGCSII